MFNKILSRIGIGGTKVDTRLFKSEFSPGETMFGEVHLFGGSTEQDVARVFLEVVTKYQADIGYEECVLLEHELTGPFRMLPGQEMVLPVEVWLPYETPLTLGTDSVSLRTVLDIRGAVDPGDRDPIEVIPTPLMQAVLDGLKALGFELQGFETRYAPHFERPVPFVQGLLHVPRGGEFLGAFDALSVMFEADDDGMTVLFGIDRRTRGLAGWFSSAADIDEHYIQLDVIPEDAERTVEEWAGLLADVLRQGGA
jgi:sporulation-control protein